MAQRIRKATLADAEAIARLHLASYWAAYQGLVSAKVLSGLDLGDRIRRWQASLSNPERRTLIAEDGAESTLAGFAEVGPSRDEDAAAGIGELMALHVTPSRWRQGLGRALHGAALATLAMRGFQAATLWVLTRNQRARAFYGAMGWKHDGTARDHVVRGIPVAEVRYHTARLNRMDGL